MSRRITNSRKAGTYPVAGEYDTSSIHRGGEYIVGGEYPIAGEYIVGGEYDFGTHEGAGFFDDVWSGIKSVGQTALDLAPVIAPIALKAVGMGIPPQEAKLLARIARIEKKLGLSPWTSADEAMFNHHLGVASQKKVAKPRAKASTQKKHKGGEIYLGRDPSTWTPQQYLNPSDLV